MFFAPEAGVNELMTGAGKKTKPFIEAILAGVITWIFPELAL
jgi:hypothetical protein